MHAFVVYRYTNIFPALDPSPVIASDLSFGY